MSTFNEMAEQWMRENMPSAETPQTAIKATKGGMADHAAAWKEDFHRWALENCVYRARCFGGVKALHNDFCDWAIARDEVPCRRKAFEWLLREAGMFFADGLVSGLILRLDFEANANFVTAQRCAEAELKAASGPLQRGYGTSPPSMVPNSTTGEV